MACPRGARPSRPAFCVAVGTASLELSVWSLWPRGCGGGLHTSPSQRAPGRDGGTTLPLLAGHALLVPRSARALRLCGVHVANGAVNRARVVGAFLSCWKQRLRRRTPALASPRPALAPVGQPGSGRGAGVKRGALTVPPGLSSPCQRTPHPASAPDHGRGAAGCSAAEKSVR